MIEIVTADQVMLCLYKRLEFTEHLRRGWKGWEMITILSNNSAKRLGKHHQFDIFWLVFVFHCSGNPVMINNFTYYKYFVKNHLKLQKKEIKW